MADLRPFRGVRPPRDVAPQLVVPPCETVSAEDAHTDVKSHPLSFFRVARPEADLPPGTSTSPGWVAARGRHNLEAFLAEGWLCPDAEARFYLYRQRMGDHVQVGVVATASVDAYNAGFIKPHKPTRAEKEAARARHLDALGGHDEPVVLTYRAREDVRALVREGTRAPAEHDFTTEDGVRHTFWCVRGDLNARLTEAFLAVPALYIVRGHHRVAAASRVHALRTARGEPGGHGRFLAVVFPHDAPRIVEYHRLVRDLNGMRAGAFLERVSEYFEVVRAARARPEQARRFGMYLDGAWFQLTPRPGTHARTPTGVLDVSILHRNLLAPVLGIGDPREDARLGFMAGIHGTAALERRVATGEAKVAFALHPPSMEQLMAVADAGDIMPPRSTWFEPRLRSGLVLHLFS